MGVEKTLGPFETRPGGVEREEALGCVCVCVGKYRTSTWDEGGGRKLPRFFALLPELREAGSRASEICVDLELLEGQGYFL